MKKKYKVHNNKGQYLIKCEGTIIAVEYSEVKAKWKLEDILGRLLVNGKIEIKKGYTK